MTDIELVKVIGEKFVQRRDVKSQQASNGAYYPVVDRETGQRYPFALQDFYDHFEGTKTFGHYLLDADSLCKFFAFDIDLNVNREADPAHGIEAFTGQYFTINPEAPTDAEAYQGPFSFDPRTDWRDRAHPSRPWVKYQLHTLAHVLTKTIEDVLGIPAAATYTGHKGIHVYGFTGTAPAEKVREGATIILDYLACWEPARGKAFWKHTDNDPFTGFPNVTLEVFPKQTSLDGKDLGNLLRLPLGRNRKAPADPTFFIDLRAPMGELRPHPSPVELLRSGDNWS